MKQYCPPPLVAAPGGTSSAQKTLLDSASPSAAMPVWHMSGRRAHGASALHAFAARLHSPTELKHVAPDAVGGPGWLASHV